MKPSVLLYAVALFLIVTLVRAETRPKPVREDLNPAAGVKAPAPVATPARRR
jgi:hypothetical protein